MAVAFEPRMMLARKEEVVGSVGQPATGAPDSRTVAPDDETLAREAVERFRQIYNARLVSHLDPRPGGLLTFQPCTIAVIADEATAACPTSTSSPDSTDARIWIIWLRRISGEWRIGSVQAPDGS